MYLIEPICLVSPYSTSILREQHNNVLHKTKINTVHMCVHLTQYIPAMCQNYNGPYKMLFQLKRIICMSKWWRWEGRIFVQCVNIYKPEDSGLLGCDAVSLDECLLTLQRMKNTSFGSPGTMHPTTPHHIPKNLRAHEHCSANHKSCHLDRRCKRLMIHGKGTVHPRTGYEGPEGLDGGGWSTPCPGPLTTFNT